MLALAPFGSLYAYVQAHGEKLPCAYAQAHGGGFYIPHKLFSCVFCAFSRLSQLSNLA